MIKLALPYPPTINHYYGQAAGGRKFIKAKGRKFRNDVRVLVKQAKADLKLSGPIMMTVWAFVPDNRVRDTDNLNKALLDALTHAGVYEDDSKIVNRNDIKKPKYPGGAVVVKIEQIEQSETEKLEAKLLEVISPNDWHDLYVVTPEESFVTKLIELANAYKV